MNIKEITPENLTPNQAKYFQPSKALPYKDYIIDKSFQGMTPTEIHRKLHQEFPESKDVTLDSLKRMVKKYNTKAKAKPTTKQATVNKSDEIRKLVKEMIANNVELNGTNIIKTLANRGVKVTYTHVAMAVGQGLINKEFTLTTAPVKTSSTFPNDITPCSFDDLLATKEFVDKLGGLDNTINALATYAKFAK